MSHMRPPLAERARGRWKGLLSLAGIDGRYLTGKHGPCPICKGGKDRFRFTDHEGTGAWICNQCGHGTGADLVMQVFGLDFKSAAERIEQFIEAAPVEERKQQRSLDELRAAMGRLWGQGKAIGRDCPAGRYLAARGISLDRYPVFLRSASDVRFQGPPVSSHPAMLAKVIGPDGTAVNLHRTYLTTDGHKAPVDDCRKMMQGPLPAGSAIRLAPAGKVLGVGEGIETCLSASLLFGVPVWALINEGNLQRFVPPKDVEKLLIFGDNDMSNTGQAAAYILARDVLRFCQRNNRPMTVEVHLPPQRGADWNDALLAQTGRSVAA